MPTVIMLLVSELGRTLSIVGNDEVIDLMKIYLISGSCEERVPGAPNRQAQCRFLRCF